MLHTRLAKKSSKKIIWGSLASCDFQNQTDFDFNFSIKSFILDNNDNFYFDKNIELTKRINNFWNQEIIYPSFDCYYILLIEIEKNFIPTQTQTQTLKTLKQEFIVIRVGEPIVRCFYQNKNLIKDEIITYKQYDKNGDIIANDYLIDLKNGLYYFIVSSQDDSVIEIKNKREHLSLPYEVDDFEFIPFSNGNYFDTKFGYGTFGFGGIQNSYFDLNTKKWIFLEKNDFSQEAKASDLIKAVCVKYDLEYSNQSSENFINKFILSLKIYDEEVGAFRNYIPGITPENSINNFKLITTDEINQTYIRGILILFNKIQPKELENDFGLIIPFNNILL